MHLLSLVSLLSLAATFEAVAVPQAHELHEKRGTLPPRWTKRDRVQLDQLLPMRISLAQRNLETGYDKLMDVSDPTSPNFGKHWTAEEVISYFRPSNQTEEEVRNWLISNGIDSTRITHADNKAWFTFFATTSEAENLLHTEYHEYEDSVTSVIVPACEEYHLPKSLRRHIDYITPGIGLLAPPESSKPKWNSLIAAREQEKRTAHDFFQPKEPEPPANISDLSGCDITITPACISALYQIPPTPLNPHPNNTMGIFASADEFYTQIDLDLFFASLTSGAIPSGTKPIPLNIDGSIENLYEAGTEVNMDLQLAYPIVYPQTITLYKDGFRPSELYYFDSFLGVLNGSYCIFPSYNLTGNDSYVDQAYPNRGGWKGQLMCGVRKPTNVISVSYGRPESSGSSRYSKWQCEEFMKLGLQGVSVLFSSGDSGVAAFPDLCEEGCTGLGNDVFNPTGCIGPGHDVFNPNFPGGCPYITSVGATKVYPGKTVSDPESAAYSPAPKSEGHYFDYSSGGGFSNLYAIPDYQKSAVATFFNNHEPGYKYYSGLVGGTSADDVTGNITPSSVMDIDELAGKTGGIYNRIGRGYPDVAAVGENIGIFNGGNWLHMGGTSASAPIFAAVVNRINEERLRAGKGPIGFLNPSLYANPGMLNDIVNGTNPGCDTLGFSAVKGWDPVTGLGTPNYPKMLEYYLGLP